MICPKVLLVNQHYETFRKDLIILTTLFLKYQGWKVMPKKRN